MYVVFFCFRIAPNLKKWRQVVINFFARKTWEKYLWQGNGVKCVEYCLEAKYKIILEHGKENMSITCKSHVSNLLHH
jgi:hypothetical protein